eukprot:scpid98233/ scgid22141/ 
MHMYVLEWISGMPASKQVTVALDMIDEHHNSNAIDHKDTRSGTFTNLPHSNESDADISLQSSEDFPTRTNPDGYQLVRTHPRRATAMLRIELYDEEILVAVLWPLCCFAFSLFTLLLCLDCTCGVLG